MTLPIQLAMDVHGSVEVVTVADVQAAIAAAVAQEREACAVYCETQFYDVHAQAGQRLAKGIRARGAA